MGTPGQKGVRVWAKGLGVIGFRVGLSRGFMKAYKVFIRLSGGYVRIA